MVILTTGRADTSGGQTHPGDALSEIVLGASRCSLTRMCNYLSKGVLVCITPFTASDWGYCGPHELLRSGVALSPPKANPHGSEHSLNMLALITNPVTPPWNAGHPHFSGHWRGERPEACSVVCLRVPLTQLSQGPFRLGLRPLPGPVTSSSLPQLRKVTLPCHLHTAHSLPALSLLEAGPYCCPQAEPCTRQAQ